MSVHLNFVTNPKILFTIQVAPDNLVRKGFKIRGFSKANIEKTYLRTEVDLKSRGLLNQGPEPRASGRPLRSNSHNNLPSPESIAKINAASASLTYKEVSEFFRV